MTTNGLLKYFDAIILSGANEPAMGLAGQPPSVYHLKMDVIRAV